MRIARLWFLILPCALPGCLLAESPLSLASSEADGVLSAALEVVQPLHILVYAVLDTFCWRKDGGTPDGAICQHVRMGSLGTSSSDREEMPAGDGSQAWTSPLEPAVRFLLPSLVRALVGTKGVGGPGLSGYRPAGVRRRSERNQLCQ